MKSFHAEYQTNLNHIKKTFYFGLAVLFATCINFTVSAQVNSARNPVIFADVPDMSMIRVDNSYYMSSTTMHMSPGVPIMKSKDLINWQIVNYAYDILDNVDALTLNNGKNAYGKVPDTLDLPASKGLIRGIIAPDEFNRRKGDRALPLVWQWNHNPDNNLWSVTKRKGYLRLTTSRIDTVFVSARNTLTQRTFGPECAGSTSIDISNMKDGDFAGLALLQRKYGLVGVKFNNGAKSIVMVNAQSGKPVEVESVPLTQKTAYLKAECNFRDKADIANFFYSLDGKTWTPIRAQLKMEYSMPHFMGYRFGLFNYSTKMPGGFVDFDWFRIGTTITVKN